MLQLGVGAEKIHLPQNSQNLGDRKCLGKLRKSFVGLPDAILFLRILQERVFQQAITLDHSDRKGDFSKPTSIARRM